MLEAHPRGAGRQKRSPWRANTKVHLKQQIDLELKIKLLLSSAVSIWATKNLEPRLKIKLYKLSDDMKKISSDKYKKSDQAFSGVFDFKV